MGMAERTPKPHSPQGSLYERRHLVSSSSRFENQHEKQARVSPSALKFFNSCPWDKWWTEFLTSRDKKGGMTYRTAWAFARVKAKGSTIERDIIYGAIGPRCRGLEDVKHDGKKRSRGIPHLGNWEQLRAKAYFYDNESVDAMRKTIAERLDGLEAGRGAATVVLDLIAKWVKYDDKIDDVFSGSPVQEGLSATAQAKRATTFLALKRNTMRGVLELIDKYLACHGISHDGMNDLGQLVMAVSNSAAKSALAGAATGAVIANQKSAALDQLTRAIYDKSKIFNMALPAAVGAEDEGEKN